MTYTEVSAADSSQCAEKPLDTGAQGSRAPDISETQDRIADR